MNDVNRIFYNKKREDFLRDTSNRDEQYNFSKCTLSLYPTLQQNHSILLQFSQSIISYNVTRNLLF